MAKESKYDEIAPHFIRKNGVTKKVRHLFRVTVDWDDKDISYESVMDGIASALNECSDIEVISVNEDDDCPN